MKSKIYLAAVALTAMALFNGCAKDGAVGPQGPAGADGNANVSTNNISENPNSWVDDGFGGWQATFAANNFDPTLGAVCAYSSTDDANWSAMPSIGYTAGAPDINYSFNANNIYVYYDPQQTESSIAQPNVTWYFKFVVIPPARKANLNINWRNYNEVKAALGLKD